MDKSFILFVEGCQGVGKSTICRELREKLKYTTLLDLSAIGDKTKQAEIKMFNYHKNILDMFGNSKLCEMNYVCCRSFQSERVYAQLNYKPYDFKVYNDVLIHHLDMLSNYYNIYFVLLTSEPGVLENRLNRNKFEYNPFSVKNSMAQQKQYKIELDYLAKHSDGIKCYTIQNDDLNLTVNSIKDIILKDMVGDDK